MKSATERQLMRLLHGELPADDARRLEQRLTRDSELRAAYRRLGEAWSSLELPEPAVPPEGFARRVVHAAREIRDDEPSGSFASAWSRAGAAAALATGIALGVMFGGGFTEVPFPEGAEIYAEAEPLSLAEIYWISLEEEKEGPLEGDATSTEGRIR